HVAGGGSDCGIQPRDSSWASGASNIDTPAQRASDSVRVGPVPPVLFQVPGHFLAAAELRSGLRLRRFCLYGIGADCLALGDVSFRTANERGKHERLQHGDHDLGDVHVDEEPESRVYVDTAQVATMGAESDRSDGACTRGFTHPDV